MDGFGTIRLHHRTIKRFRRFSKKITKSYSETLEAAMDFFEWHGISPFSRFAKQISQEEEKTRKRINALIAIIRDIEIHQTKPTTEMLLSLFGEKMKEEEEPILVEKKFVKLTRDEWNEKEKTVPKAKYDDLKSDLKQERARTFSLLKEISYVKNRLGKDYHKIDIERERLARLIREYEQKDL